MTIAQNSVAKLSVAFVTVAMLFSLVAPAQAQTVEELQAQIAALMAQINAASTTTTTTTTGSCTTPAAPLTMGSQGAEVTALQNMLISMGQSIPAGATGYFGAQTQSALAAWQAANGVSPAAGYYGPITKAAMDAKCVPATTGGDEDDEDEDDTEAAELSGEASLDNVEVDDAADTDVEEGNTDAEVAVMTVEFADGDAEISRIDLTLQDGEGTDSDPWDAFETISLWVDGDMVAEFAADDEDDYLSENTGEIRFSGLDIVAMEDEEVEIVVAATIMNNLDAESLGEWDVEATAIRYFDADGVATTETGTVVTGAGTAVFDIDVEGAGEELTFSLSADSPDSTDIIVDVDDSTDGVTIMQYDIEGEEGDIELDLLVVRVETGTADVTDIVEDAYLVIDGQTFKAEAIGGTTGDDSTVDSETSVLDNADGQGVWYAFNIDGDVTIDADDEIAVEVVVDLASTDDGAVYAAGETIQAFVGTAERDLTDAEGADTITTLSGTVTGDQHILVDEGVYTSADSVETTADASGDNDTTGEFSIEFDVTAVEGDFYINDLASRNGSTTLGGVEFEIESSGAGVATAISGSLSSTGDEGAGGAFLVREGDTETFTLNVTFTASTGGQFRVVLEEVWYATATNGTSAVLYAPTPASDYRTDYKQVNS